MPPLDRDPRVDAILDKVSSMQADVAVLRATASSTAEEVRGLRDFRHKAGNVVDAFPQIQKMVEDHEDRLDGFEGEIKSYKMAIAGILAAATFLVTFWSQIKAFFAGPTGS